MNRIILIVFFIFIADAFYGQETFIKTFGGDYYDFANDMIINRDGHYVITGCISDSNTVTNEILRHCCLMEIDENGDIIWQKTYFEDYFSQGTSVEQLDDGGYIVGCYKSEPEIFKPEICLIRTNAYGDTVWTKAYGFGANSSNVIVKQTSDSGFALTSTKDDSGSGLGLICLIKTNEYGNVLWETITSPMPDEFNQTNSILVTSDNEYMVLGVSLNTGFLCSFLTKYNSEGGVYWTKIFGEYQEDKGANEIIVTNSGEYIIFGSVVDYINYVGTPYLMNVDENGNVGWIKEFDLTSGNNGGMSFVHTSDGGFLIVFSGDDIDLIKTDNTGDIQWTKHANYMHDVHITTVLQTNSQAYVFAGGAEEIVNSLFTYDILLFKTDMLGNLGSEEVAYNNDIVYPNPNSGLFYIKHEETPEKIALFNSLGQCIYSCNSFEEGNLIRVDVQKAVSGIYYLRLTTPNGIKTGKVLINN